MVNYDLTIESVPTGIEMRVSALGFSQWIVTNKTLTYAESTSIEVIAPPVCGEPQGTEEKGFKFIKWEDDTTDPKRTVVLSADKTITATYEQQQYYPVRHFDKRKNKYQAKTDEEVAKLRVVAEKSMMVEQHDLTANEQTRMEELVGKYVNTQGLYGSELHHYRNFSQELFGLRRLFFGETLNKEASLRAQKWKTRGLNQTHLEAIAKLFNITLTFA